MQHELSAQDARSTSSSTSTMDAAKQSIQASTWTVAGERCASLTPAKLSHISLDFAVSLDHARGADLVQASIKRRGLAHMHCPCLTLSHTDVRTPGSYCRLNVMSTEIIQMFRAGIRLTRSTHPSTISTKVKRIQGIQVPTKTTLMILTTELTCTCQWLPLGDIGRRLATAKAPGMLTTVQPGTGHGLLFALGLGC